MRRMLYGHMYMIELAPDGTGLIRDRSNGAPVAALTTAASGRIAAASGDLIDRLAEEAAKSPAPWSTPELARDISGRNT